MVPVTAPERIPSQPAQTRPAPLAVALWLAAQGIHVHPLSPGGKIPPRGCDRCYRGTKAQPNPHYVDHSASECPCLPAGGWCHGVRAATVNAASIQGWWQHVPDAGVGIACGPSGLVILDIDNHGAEPPQGGDYLPGVPLSDTTGFASGWDSIAALAEVRGAPLPWLSPPTMAVLTPSGGLHAWFRVEDADQWRQGSGKLGWQLDLKAGWGYGIAPGTRAPKGVYQAIGDCRTIAPLPAWLAADLTRAGHRREPQPVRPAVAPQRHRLAGGRGYVAAAVRDELDKVATAPNGTRSERINEAAFCLGSLVGAGLLDRDAVHEAITSAATAAGVDPGERKAQDTIRRGIEAGMRSPRQIGAHA